MAMVRKFIQKKFADPVWRIEVLAAAVFLCGVVLLGWFSFPWVRQYFSGQGGMRTQSRATAEETLLPCVFRRALDGVCVSAEAEVHPPLVGVMVENNFEAWPLSGISKARVVYEAPVEGNIPRFFAVYLRDSTVEAVGPVRSARPYFVDWADEYPGMMYLHVGGSAEALAALERQNIFSLNEMTRGWYFWRDDSRRAPHNTYTSSRLWRQAFADYAHAVNSSTIAAWQFDDRDPCADTCVPSTTVQYAGGGYSATWRYNPDSGKYERFQIKDTEPDRDTDGTIIAADTVIVQYVSTQILDAVGRLSLNTIGTGDAVIFRDGYRQEGRWIKTASGQRTSWIDATGAPVALRAGQIWVEVLSR